MDRTNDPTRLSELATQLDGVKREQAYDRQVSPRAKKPGRGGPRR